MNGVVLYRSMMLNGMIMSRSNVGVDILIMLWTGSDVFMRSWTELLGGNPYKDYFSRDTDHRNPPRDDDDG